MSDESILKPITKGGLVSQLVPGNLEIIAVFERSLYAKDLFGNILCLSGANLPIGPFSLSCEPWQLVSELKLETGNFLYLNQHKQILIEHYKLELAKTSLILPSIQPKFMCQKVEQSFKNLTALWQILPLKGGLSPLFDYILEQGKQIKAQNISLIETAMLEIGQQGLAELELWLKGQISTLNLKAATMLIGLGPGLTPSGDDVLGGIFLALHKLGHDELLQNLAGYILPLAKEQTNQISYAYLQAASLGYASSVLHEALVAFLNNSQNLNFALAGLDRMGHSSGWDGFLGAILVCKHWMRLN